MSTNTKVNVDLISVNTKKTQNEFKSLKDRIKELRSEIQQLDEGTAEYQAKITELGNTQHAYNEIVEQSKLATQDLGQNLSNINKVTSGVVGSISLVSGALNILGVNSDTATEALLKTQSLLSIIAGLQALDDAEKNFQALWGKIKSVTQARKEEAQEEIKDTAITNTNTNAVKQNAEAIETQGKALNNSTSKTKLLSNGLRNLGKSLKSFALSNPFTLIVTGLTTAISLISTFRQKAEQARIDAEQALTDNILGLSANNSKDTQQNTFTNSKVSKDYYKDLKEVRKELNETQQTQQKIFEQQREYDREYIENENKRIEQQKKYLEERKMELDLYTEEQKKVEPYLTYWEQYNNDLIDIYKQQIALNQRNYNSLKQYLNGLKKDTKDYNQALEDLKRTEEEIVKLSENDLLKSYQEVDKLLTQRTTKETQAKEEAKSNREKYLQEQYTKIREWLELEQKQIELAFTKREITEKDYYDKSINLYEQYINKLNSKLKNNPNVSKIDRLTAEGSVLDAKKKLAEYEIELIKQRIILAEQTDILVIDEQKRLENDIDKYTELINQNNAKIADLRNKNWLEQYNILQQQNRLTEEEQISHLDNLTAIELQYLEEQQTVLSGNYNRDKNISEETYQRDLEILQKQLEAKILTEEQYNYSLLQLETTHKNDLLNLENEYNLQLIDIQAQRNQIELDYSNQRYEIARNEAERKISLNETYFNSFQNIQSQLSSFLSEYQNSMDSNSEKYKELQRLQIIMDSASGSYSAFVSAFKSGVPFPYNLVMGGLASSLVIGQGVLALNNLNNNKIGTTNAVNNLGQNSVYETLSYQQLGNIESTIRDSKVYVLESDISNVANRVNVVEMESRF